MGKRKSGRLYQPILLRTAWPLAEKVEEYSGDSAILHTPKYKDFKQIHPKSLDECTWNAIEDSFQKEYLSYIEGKGFNEPVWREICQKLQLQYEIKHERCEMIPARKKLSNALLSDICEDHLPQIGLFSDELIFGPLSERRLPNSMRQLAGAVCSMLPLLEHGQSTITKISSQRPRIIDDIYYSLTAYHRTPFMLWKKKRAHLDHVEAQLPIADQYVPSSSVENLPDAPYFLGKIIKQGDHFVLSCAFGISEIDLLRQILTDRHQIEWIRYQRYSRISWEDLLREKGDLLYRTASELIFEGSIKQCSD